MGFLVTRYRKKLRVRKAKLFIELKGVEAQRLSTEGFIAGTPKGKAFTVPFMESPLILSRRIAEIKAEVDLIGLHLVVKD